MKKREHELSEKIKVCELIKQNKTQIRRDKKNNRTHKFKGEKKWKAHESSWEEKQQESKEERKKQ